MMMRIPIPMITSFIFIIKQEENACAITCRCGRISEYGLLVERGVGIGDGGALECDS